MPKATFVDYSALWSAVHSVGSVGCWFFAEFPAISVTVGKGAISRFTLPCRHSPLHTPRGFYSSVSSYTLVALHFTAATIHFCL